MTAALLEMMVGLTDARERLVRAIETYDSADHQRIEAEIVEKLLNKLAGPMHRRPDEVREEAARLSRSLQTFQNRVTTIHADAGMLQLAANVAASSTGIAKMGATFDHLNAWSTAIAAKLTRTTSLDDPMSERAELDRIAGGLDQDAIHILRQAELGLLGSALVIELHCENLSRFVGQRLRRPVSVVLADLRRLTRDMIRSETLNIVIDALGLSLMLKPVTLLARIIRAVLKPFGFKPSATDELIVLQKIIVNEEAALDALKISIDRGHVEVDRIADAVSYTSKIIATP